MKLVLAIVLLGATFVTAQTNPDEADTAYRAQQWEKAAKLYAARTEADPKNAQAVYRLGVSLNGLKRHQEAIAAFEKWLPMVSGPALGFGMYGMASAHAGLGHKDQALEWLKKAIDAGYPMWQQMESDPQLASVRNDARFAAIIDQARRAAEPCKYEPEYRAFDFWIGHWEVFGPQGQKNGENVIEKILDNCVLVENWTSAYGSTGKSFNAYNPVRKKWQQYWVDSSGNVLELTGDASDGKVAFLGTYFLKGQTEPQIHRLTFTRLPDGSVRQVGEGSSDGGKTFQVQFDFKYVKKKLAGG